NPPSTHPGRSDGRDIRIGPVQLPPIPSGRAIRSRGLLTPALGSRGADAARHRSNAALLMYGEIPGEALHDPQPVSTLGGLSGSLSVLTGCHVGGDDFES